MDIDITRRNRKPRMLTDQERDRLKVFIDHINYSQR